MSASDMWLRPGVALKLSRRQQRLHLAPRAAEHIRCIGHDQLGGVEGEPGFTRRGRRENDAGRSLIAARRVADYGCREERALSRVNVLPREAQRSLCCRQGRVVLQRLLDQGIERFRVKQGPPLARNVQFWTKRCASPPSTSAELVCCGSGSAVYPLTSGAAGLSKSGPTAQPASTAMTTQTAAMRGPLVNRFKRKMGAVSVLAANTAAVNARIGLWRTLDGSILLRLAAHPLPTATSTSRSDRDDIFTSVRPWR